MRLRNEQTTERESEDKQWVKERQTESNASYIFILNWDIIQNASEDTWVSGHQ